MLHPTPLPPFPPSLCSQQHLSLAWIDYRAPLISLSLLHSDIFQVHSPSSNQTVVILKVNLLKLLLVPNPQQFAIKRLSITTKVSP